jgi:TPR repeat protein
MLGIRSGLTFRNWRMRKKVFISYRRDDSAGYAGRMHDRLERDLGRDFLFMDVDAIPPGANFVQVLQDEVSQCAVLLAMIGTRWLDARDERGNRRLDNPDDFVRIEIAVALAREIPVVPLLLDGAGIPKPDQLPGDLRALTLRNAMEVRHASFHPDMDKLIGWLREQLEVSGESADGFLALQRRVAAGDPAAQFDLGWKHEKGLDGLPVDEREAARHYKLAADRGVARAQTRLGIFYQYGRGGLPKNESEAARFLKLAAEKGDADAQWRLAIYYEDGRGGLPKDEREAARLFRLAADQGQAFAQNTLGAFYEQGRGGLPKDPCEAARLFRLAADQGDAFAQTRLGHYHLYGSGGLPRDEREAARLFRLAADQGNTFALNKLGVFYERGRGGLPKDPREAARLFKLASDRRTSGQ